MLKRIEENIDKHFLEYNKICQEIYEGLEVYIKTILTTYNIKKLLFSHNNRFVINLYYEYIDEYINDIEISGVRVDNDKVQFCANDAWCDLQELQIFKVDCLFSALKKEIQNINIF